MTSVLVTRPEGQADELTALLGERDIRGVHVPTVAIALGDRAELVGALNQLTEGGWLVVTSVKGAAAVVDALEAGARRPDCRVAAIGPATAEALRSGGVSVDVVPTRYLTAAISDAMGEVRGRRVLLARADLATPELYEDLVSRGADVREVVAYRTLEGPPESREPLLRAMERGVDGILFTSGSTVRGLNRLLPAHRRQPARSLPVFCIGPVTAQVARHSGFWVAGIAVEHTARGLAAVTARHYSKENA